MLLIADSGSTNTTWLLCDGASIVAEIHTGGINPFYMEESAVAELVCRDLLPRLEGCRIESLHFYGAGCIPGAKSMVVVDALHACFTDADVEVLSDLWGACRGLCGRDAGIVCILGTGSNSCYYDGEKIIRNVPPLGFVLGDEGSGAVLGKSVLADYLKGLMPSDLSALFESKYDCDSSAMLDRVYRQPFPNRYLASFAPFLSENISHPYINRLVYGKLSEFVERNIQHYPSDVPVNFTGSVAFHFKSVLQDVCISAGFSMGRISQSPVYGLADYHCVIDL